MLTSISDLFLLGFISIAFILSLKSGYSSLSFTKLSAVLNSSSLDSNTLKILSIFLLIGLIGKSAQFPFYIWLPDAMVAPTPVSALLHSATVVSVPIVFLAQLLFFNPGFLLNATFSFAALAIALVTMLISSILAIIENNIKRLLAYSTISQTSLILLGLFFFLTMLLQHGFLFSNFFLMLSLRLLCFCLQELQSICLKQIT